MSYPCVESVVANYKSKKENIRSGKNNVKIFHHLPSVDRSVELVRRNLLNEIDGRDLARIVALEANNDILAYTVSVEEGSYYDQRHLNADFNSRTLVNQMHHRWGKSIRFRQVILDYFWSPSGSWAMKHWQRSFFNENIPRLVTERLLNFGDLENDLVFVSAKESNVAEDYVTSTAAVVYLPSNVHCLSQVVACYDKLSQYYTISFLRKDQLDEHTLWKATNTISPESMQGFLAKTINQEEIYCKLDIGQVKRGTGDASVTTEDILDVFNRIDRPDEVRMIKLTAIRKFHPDYSKSGIMLKTKPILGLNKGGFVGLLSKRQLEARKRGDAMAVKDLSRKQIDEPEMSRRKQISGPEQTNQQIPKKRSLSHQRLDKHVSRKRARKDVLLPKPHTNNKPKSNALLTEWNNMLASVESNWANQSSSYALVDNIPVETSNSNICLVTNELAEVEANESIELNTAEKVSDSIIPSDAPLAMSRLAKLRRSKPTTKAVEQVERATAIDPPQHMTYNHQTTLKNNDVIMVANEHSHPGNIQFFNALAICVKDFSQVADCFVDALKSLNPPGRFMARDESTGSLEIMDYDAAIQLAPYFVDIFVLNRTPPICDSKEDSSPDFLLIVQRFFDAKSKGGSSGSISQLSDPSWLNESRAISPQTLPIPREVDCSPRKPVVSTLLPLAKQHPVAVSGGSSLDSSLNLSTAWLRNNG